jgi:MerR family glutamine synthetase transcriptional repressor
VKEEAGSAPVYSMGVAERLTGLTARQIRYWEQQELLTPARTKGRQRLYSEADIAKLKEIKKLLAEGYTLDRVRAHYQARELRQRRLAEELARQKAARLTSLYPVNDRAELLRRLERERSLREHQPRRDP